MVPQPSGQQPYQVVARRFRPRDFADLVGQEAIVRSLHSALGSERVPHAFLFSGSRGVGKTTLARILARALNCENGPTAEPCGSCASCRSILDGVNPDIVEIDAASHNLVEDIRELRDRVGFASMGSRYKVYILDEVHMLTRSAFNAFLKTLEEPPSGVVFILATTELHKVPDTIRSRCQVLLFRRLGEADIAKRLRMICECEKVRIPDEVLHEIAATSRGGMRDAETALEQVLPVAVDLPDGLDLETWRRLTHRVGQDRAVAVVADLVRGDAASGLQFAAAVERGGIDERQAMGEVLEILRAVLLLKVDGPDTGLVELSDGTRERLRELAEAADVHQLDAMIQAGLIGRERIRRFEDRRLVLEVTLLRMASAGQLPALGALVAAAESGTAVPAAGGQAAPTGGAADRAPPDLRSQLLEKLKSAKPMLVRTVEQCRLSEPNPEGIVILELPGGSRLHRDRLESKDVQIILRDLLTQLLGQQTQLAIRIGDAPPQAAAAEKPRAEPGPAVRKVVEKFDGQILEVDDPDRT